MAQLNIAGWSSSVARRAHNPKVVGSNPASATMLRRVLFAGFSVFVFIFFPYRGVEQLVARWAHNPKAVGSNPTPATTRPA